MRFKVWSKLKIYSSYNSLVFRKYFKKIQYSAVWGEKFWV